MPTSKTLGSGARVLIVHADRLYSDLLRRSIEVCITTAKVLIACTIAEASAALAQEPVDLLVTSVLAADGEVISVLPEWIQRQKSVQHALVVTSRKEPWVLEQLATSPVRGVCDADANAEEFQMALSKAAVGANYWSPTMCEALSRGRARLADLNLSPNDWRVFPIIATGADDSTAADELGMTAGAVNSARKRLYRKLGLQHKGQLLDPAIELGFVITNRGSLVRSKYAASADRGDLETSSDSNC